MDFQQNDSPFYMEAPKFELDDSTSHSCVDVSCIPNHQMQW